MRRRIWTNKTLLHYVTTMTYLLVTGLVNDLLSFSIIRLEYHWSNSLQAKDEGHLHFCRVIDTICFFTKRLWYSFGLLSRCLFVGVFIVAFSSPCSFSAKSCSLDPLSQKTFKINSNSFIFYSKLINLPILYSFLHKIKSLI